ncbi:hypothetical protein HD554DRAFT_2317853 [Boletus coccyginus]|nr:hypothetical protein HD554DRAFT_2317853 [Boletus coccyginus]
MNDIDASSKPSRDTYEELITPALVASPSLSNKPSLVSIDHIDAVELISGTTRIPVVRACIQVAIAGRFLNTTLIQDEIVARDATFACAFFSPTLRVREFRVKDIDILGAFRDEDRACRLPPGNVIPATRRGISVRPDLKFLCVLSGPLEKLREKEGQMHASDELVQDNSSFPRIATTPSKNTFLIPTTNPRALTPTSNKAKLFALLQSTEDWPYSEQGEDATKSRCAESHWRPHRRALDRRHRTPPALLIPPAPIR